VSAIFANPAQFIRELNRVSATLAQALDVEGIPCIPAGDHRDALTEPNSVSAVPDRALAELACSFEDLRSRLRARIGGTNWLGKLPANDPLCTAVSYFGTLDLGLRETAHTRMLAWLMDPSENHGFDNILLQVFLREIFALDHDPKLSEEVRIDSEIVSGESRDRLDICMRGEWLVPGGKTQSWLVIIEAKIDADEGENQCARYEMQCRERIASSDRHKLIFLTTNGKPPKTESKASSWRRCTFIRLMALFRTQLPLLTGKPGFDVLRHYMTGVLKDLYQLNCGRISERDDLFLISEYLPQQATGAE